MRKRQNYKIAGATVGQKIAIIGLTMVGAKLGAVGGPAAYITATGGASPITSSNIGAFFTGSPGWVFWLTLALGTAIGAAVGYKLGYLEEDHIGMGGYAGGKVGYNAAALIDYIRGDDEREFVKLQKNYQNAQQLAADSARREDERVQARTAQIQREIEEKTKLLAKLIESTESKIEAEQKRDDSLRKQNIALHQLSDQNREIIKQFSQKIEKLAEESKQKDLTITLHKNHMDALDDIVRCPIGCTIMKTPITPGDGRCYEAKELQKFCDTEAEKGKIFMPYELYKEFRNSSKQSLEEKEEAKYICSPITRIPLLPPKEWTKDINVQQLIDQYRQYKTKQKTGNKEEKYRVSNPSPSAETVPSMPRQDHILVGQSFRAIGGSVATSAPSGQVEQQPSVDTNSMDIGH